MVPKSRERAGKKLWKFENSVAGVKNKNKKNMMMKNELMEKVQSGKFSSDDEILENV